jgi:gamma-glutamylcyclotransferase (GGCT)/AIG2-like uncharacterized protein YtfP
MDKNRVFVYGTVRRGGVRAMDDLFPGARFVGGGEVSGRLYDLGEYPGLQLGGSDSQVVGEVYEIDDETLNKLDDIEASSDYRRGRIEVSLGGDRVTCWVYAPAREVCLGRRLIESGDWIEYAKART